MIALDTVGNNYRKCREKFIENKLLCREIFNM